MNEHKLTCNKLKAIVMGLEEKYKLSAQEEGSGSHDLQTLFEDLIGFIENFDEETFPYRMTV